MLLIGCHREALYHKNLKWLNLRKSPSALFLPASSNVLHMHRYFIICLNWILTQTRENPPPKTLKTEQLGWKILQSFTRVFLKCSFCSQGGKKERRLNLYINESLFSCFQYICLFLFFPLPTSLTRPPSFTSPPLHPPPPPLLRSFSTACSCSYFFLAIQLIYIELYVSGVPWANGCLKFLPVVTSLSLAFVLPGSPPQGGIRRHSSSAGLSEYFTKPPTAS